MTIFSNFTLQVLEKALDGSNLKQKAISHNISNINTPGFKGVDVDFKSQLKTAIGESQKLNLRKTTPLHISNNYSIEDVSPQVYKTRNTSMRADGNNVNIDKEMVDLVENAIYYNTAVAQVNKRLAVLKYVLQEGGR